jgi:hypothetical protein
MEGIAALLHEQAKTLDMDADAIVPSSEALQLKQLEMQMQQGMAPPPVEGGPPGAGGRQRAANEDPQQNKQQLMTGEPITDNMGPPGKAEGFADGGLVESLVDLPRRAVNASSKYVGRIGPAWSQSNAEFNQTNPSVGDRVFRSVNPITGFGTAVGKLHDAASLGDVGRMATAAMQASPHARTALIGGALGTAADLYAGDI